MSDRDLELGFSDEPTPGELLQRRGYLVDQQLLAQILNVTTRTIRNFDREGMPRRNEHYCLPDVVSWLIARAEQRTGSRAGLDARTELAVAKTEKLREEITAVRAAVVEIEEAGRALLAIDSAYAKALAPVASRVVAELTGDMNEAERQQVITRVIHAARDQVANTLQRWADSAAPLEQEQEIRL